MEKGSNGVTCLSFLYAILSCIEGYQLQENWLLQLVSTETRLELKGQERFVEMETMDSLIELLLHRMWDFWEFKKNLLLLNVL